MSGSSASSPVGETGLAAPARDASVPTGLATTVLTVSAWLLVLAVLALALVASGRAVANPAGWSLSELGGWFRRQPVGATFRLLSVGALLVVLYLMVCTVAMLLAETARAVRRPHLARIAEVVAAPVVKRAVAGVLGLGITISASPLTVEAAASVIQESPSTIDERSSGVATMQALDPEPLPTEDASAGAPAAERAHPSTRAGRWTIEPGDHLWGVAAATLAATWSRPPTDDETFGYVQKVIDLNRDVFVVPDQPDLVFVGQVFVLPPTGLT